ncbi:hypothetical protein TSUD_54190 [Trifolium subterraneum]|uniref:Uncharacterized protein n=1 Tax=Trifolium subterraneum TaxID=3900 RepID=A0A2Z6N6S0_TRISU|nr:hypothetical protein TSUD_54190 [Trifolium subterraneum]
MLSPCSNPVASFASPGTTLLTTSYSLAELRKPTAHHWNLYRKHEPPRTHSMPSPTEQMQLTGRTETKVGHNDLGVPCGLVPGPLGIALQVANLDSLYRQQIKKILAATGVDVPSPPVARATTYPSCPSYAMDGHTSPSMAWKFDGLKELLIHSSNSFGLTGFAGSFPLCRPHVLTTGYGACYDPAPALSAREKPFTSSFAAGALIY